MPSIISRRGLLAGAGGLAAVVGAGLLDPGAVRPPQRVEGAVPDGTWPRTRRDPARTGAQPEPGPRTTPREAWRTTVGDAAFASSTPGLTVTADSVLTTGRTETIALRPSDGRLRWRASHSEQTLLRDEDAESVQEGPVAGGTRVLIAGSVTLYALDATNGANGWAFGTNSSFTAPLVAGNTVFLNSLLGDADRLVALSLTTGLPYWRQETVGVPAAYAPDAGYLLTVRSPAGTDISTLQARDPATGAVEWETDHPGLSVTGRGLPAVAEGRVYAAQGQASAVDAATGEELWRNADAGRDLSGQVTDGRAVYAFGEGTVALDAATGERQWRAPVSPAGFGPPVVGGDRLYLPVTDGLVALETTDGSRAFEAALPGTPRALALAGGRLYARTERRVVALEGKR